MSGNPTSQALECGRVDRGILLQVRNHVYFVSGQKAKKTKLWPKRWVVMKRRDFLRSAGIVSAALAFPRTGRLLAQGAVSDAWRTFEVTTSVQVLKPSGTTRIMAACSARQRNAFPEDAR
jgi:hypothetical protein